MNATIPPLAWPLLNKHYHILPYPFTTQSLSYLKQGVPGPQVLEERCPCPQGLVEDGPRGAVVVTPHHAHWAVPGTAHQLLIALWNMRNLLKVISGDTQKCIEN